MKDKTKALHAGYNEECYGAMSVSIFQTTAYRFKDSKHAANLFALKELGISIQDLQTQRLRF